MLMLVQLTGTVIAVIGLLVAGLPELLRSAMGWWAQESRLRIAALLEAILGVVLVAGAAQTRWPTAITWLGGLAVLVGLASLATSLIAPTRLVDRTSGWAALPTPVVRAWGTVVAAIGVLLVFATR